MCIRDRLVEAAGEHLGIPTERLVEAGPDDRLQREEPRSRVCLLYTSDAADERSSVDLGGRRIIKKKKQITTTRPDTTDTSQREEARHVW